MLNFYYIASNQKGDIKEGEIEAGNEAEVLEYLQKRELSPVSIVQQKKASAKLSSAIFQRFSLSDKIMFARNMALMIRSGISITEAIDIMLDDTQNAALKKILSQVKTDLEKGGHLSDALAKFPNHFPIVFVSMIRAGEASGTMENALMQMSVQLQKEHELRRKVTSAMAYPAILVAASLGVVVLLVTMVLPRVGKIFTQSQIKLPFITQMLLNVSDFVTHRWLLSIIICLLFIVLIYFLKKFSVGRTLIYRLARKLPIISVLLQKIALTRFTRTLHSLLKSGIPIIKALEITAEGIGNSLYKKIILEMTEQEVSRGVSFGMALKRRPAYFPRLTTTMIVVGEKSGNLEFMLESLAQYYEEEVDNTLKTLVTVLEPALLLGVGLMIGTLALSIIMPIYQLIGSIR